MSAIPSRTLSAGRLLANDVSALIPDFPFNYGNYLKTAQATGAALGEVQKGHGIEVLIVGAGIAGLVTAYEVMRLGFKPIVVEASNRIGGRFHSLVKESPEGAAHNVVCELGAMRFPRSGKALMHYFEKVGMTSNSADFPNPGSAAAVSTVVDYREEQTYYETGTGNYPRPPVYERIERNFFDVFLEMDPIHFQRMERAMSQGTIDQDLIKTLWNNMLENGWDDLSFHAAMVEKAKWPAEDITLFGQIGFGTGGWNTDYPNSFLEVLRVLYTGLDTNHLLMYDGCATLPQRLWQQPPQVFGDSVAYWNADVTVKSLTETKIPDPFNKEVRHILRNDDNGTFDVTIHDAMTGTTQTLNVPNVVYTPHVRILDKLRYSDGKAQLGAMNSLLTVAQWEAVMYTHYMQSAKIFASTRRPFWNDPTTGGQRTMSVTLSDRLTRGTYLLDYAANAAPYRGSGMFLSYTWNDDSLKFLGDRSSVAHAGLCTALLEEIYASNGLDLANQFNRGDPFVELNWEDEPFFLGAFKMNLPGQYEYQRRLFSQFMDGVGEARPDGFILAGDDISWTGGWGEGAVTTALNAVNKLVVKYEGESLVNNSGPIDQWEQLKPMTIASSRGRALAGDSVLCRVARQLRSWWVNR